MSDLAINVIARSNTASVMGGAAKDINKVEAAAKSASASLQNIGKGLSSVGAGLTAGVTLPLAALGAAAVKASTDLNKGMANVASLGVATERVNELKTAVQNMAIATGKSTDDLANGLYQVVSAFGDNADSAKILEINAKAAAAGLATTTDSINLTSAVTKAFGDTSATAVQHVTDLALKSVELGQTTFPELAGAIGLVAPLAKTMGINLNEMFAVMATGSGVTGTTSQVATQFRGIIQSFMAPTDTMTKLMKSMGFASGEAMLKQQGFEKSVQLVIAASQKSGLPLQQFIGSIEGQTLALALAGPQAEKYMQNLEGMGKAAGKTDEAFKAQTEGVNALGFKMEQAKVKMTVFFQKLGDSMGPALLAVADVLTPLGDKLLALADTFQKLDPSMQKWIVGIAAAVAALGPLLFVLGNLISAVGVALPFIAAIGAALSGLLLPLGLLYVAYRLNLFGLQTFVNNGLSRIRTAAPLAGKALRELVAQLTGVGLDTNDTTEGIQHFVAALTSSEQVGIRTANWIGDIGQAAGVMQDALQTFVNGSAVYVAMNSLSESAAKVKTAFSDLFTGNIGVDQFIGKISAALSGIPAMVRTLFTSTDFTTLKSEIVTALGLDKITFDFTGVKDKVSKAISDALSSTDFSAITATFTNLPLWVSQKLSLVDWSTITTTFSSLQTWVSDKLGAIDWSLITTDFASLKTWVSDKLSKIDFSTITATFSGISTIAENLNTSLQSLTGESGGLTQLQNIITGTIQGVVNSIKGIDANQVASVGLSFSGALTSVLNVFTTLSNLGNDNVGKATAGISSLIQSILGLATSFTTGLDIAKISEAAAKFTASFVDEITKVLGSADLPGIASASVGFLKAITGQFATAMQGDAPSIIGESFGGLAAEIITQIGATLGQANLGKDVGKSITNLAGGFGDAANGIAQGIADQLTQVDWGKFGAQIHVFAEGIFSQLVKQIKENTAKAEKEQDFRRETGHQPYYSSTLHIPLSEEASKTADALKPLPAALGNFMKGLVFGPEKPVTATTVTVNANTVNLPNVIPLVKYPDVNPNDSSIRGVASDFSTWLSQLNAFSAQLNNIPPVTVEPIPPVVVPPIPPVQVPQPFWLGSLLNWHPTVSVQGPVQGAQTFFRGFASGANFAPGGWAWVGEEGPELMRIPRGAQIMSHSKSMDMIGHFADGNTGLPTGLSAAQAKGFDSFISTMAKAADKTASAQERAANKIVKAQEAAAEKIQNSIESMLQKVPGLFGSSQVTQQQMDMAKLGIPQNFADDYLRRLTDEVLNGVQWSDVDIKDAAMRAGIDPALPAKAILEMFKQKWNDSSLFADKKNLDLINMDAVKQTLIDQQNAALGKANIMELFGIKPDQAQQQAMAAGIQIAGGLSQGFASVDGKSAAANIIKSTAAAITPESVAPVGSALAAGITTSIAGTKDKDGKTIGANFGDPIVAAVGTSLANGMKTIGDSVDFVGGISTAINTQLLTTGAIESMKAVGGKIGQLLKEGIAEFFATADLAATVGAGIKSSTPVPVANKAIGSYSWQGGAVRVGDTGPEIIDVPARSRIYGRGETAAMGGGGNTHIVINATVNNDIDITSLAYRINDLQRRRR